MAGLKNRLFGKLKKQKRGRKPPSNPKFAGSRFRDFRGTQGQVDDAEGRRENQSTDSNQ